MMRADVYLTTAGHTESRKRAQDLIGHGAVRIDGATVKKSAQNIDESVPHEVEISEVFKYVSRGGTKLEAAFDAFGIDVRGLAALDVGASTGGFTDCLLKRGAKSVVSVDSGIGQLHASLRDNPRVRSVENFNARDLDLNITGGEVDIAVADVSFISQTYIIGRISGVLAPGGIFVSLIKPQFEAGRAALNKNGIVTSAAYRFLAAKRVISAAHTVGLDCAGLIPSPVTGGDGNREYLAYFIKRFSVKPAVDDKLIKRITLI